MDIGKILRRMYNLCSVKEITLKLFPFKKYLFFFFSYSEVVLNGLLTHSGKRITEPQYAWFVWHLGLLPVKYHKCQWLLEFSKAYVFLSILFLLDFIRVIWESWLIFQTVQWEQHGTEAPAQCHKPCSWALTQSTLVLQGRKKLTPNSQITSP